MAKTNPNGANQYKVDPRQALFLESYLNPESDTFSNCKQSGLKAGYGKEYSENLTNQLPTWLSKKLEANQDDEMLRKADRNINEFLDMSTKKEITTVSGEKIGDTQDPALVKIKQDTTKFVNERLNKKKWSQRSEVTGENGQPILVVPQEIIKKHEIKTNE